MLGKILKKKKDQKEEGVNPELVEKISKMNLTEMRAYVNDRVKGMPICEEGLLEVMKRLTTQDDKTQEYYIKTDDMDVKKKKAFDLVLSIANSKKLTLKTLELMQLFQVIYKDIIDEYDKEHKQIYASKLDTAVKTAIENLNKMAELKKKMVLLGEH